jgi:hypothetical protein
MEAAAYKALSVQRRAVNAQLASGAGLTSAFWAEQEIKLASRLQSALASTYQRAHRSFRSQFDLAGDSQAAAQVWATNYSKNLAGLLTVHTSNLLAKPTENDLQVRSLFQQAFGRGRAQTIAITEVTQAWTDAETSLAIPLGLKAIWRATGKSCSECLERNAKPFKGRGPPLHPRCDCFVQWL